MMKQRKIKREQQLSAVRAAKEDQFAEAIAKAQQTEDPAERIIELRRIRDSITAQITGENDAIEKKSNKIANGAFAGSASTLFIGGMGGMALLLNPVTSVAGVYVLGGVTAAYFGGALGGLGYSKSLKKKSELSAADHHKNLQGLQAYINKATDEILENNVEAIGESAFKGQLLSLPGISQKFSVAAMKNIAEMKKALAAKEEGKLDGEGKEITSEPKRKLKLA